MTDRTHDPSLRSWVESANEPTCDFPIQNLPFGTLRRGTGSHVGVAIGDQVLDVTEALQIGSLRDVMAMPKAGRVALRKRISDMLSQDPDAARHLAPMADVELLLPCEIGDYSDFYASIDHATNVGSMFRPDNPLLPNYKWLPVGYHGRASSIVVSGTAVRRPWGQTAEQPGGPPKFAPSGRLDYELEVGAFLGPGNAMGEPIPIGQASDHLFGVCLLNDWSARDMQTWEYQPLGPFLAKSFATSISPEVPFRGAVFRSTASSNALLVPRRDSGRAGRGHIRACGRIPARCLFPGSRTDWRCRTGPVHFHSDKPPPRWPPRALNLNGRTSSVCGGL